MTLWRLVLGVVRNSSVSIDDYAKDGGPRVSDHDVVLPVLTLLFGKM